MIDRLLTKSNASLVPVFSLVLLLLAAWPVEAAELDDTIALCTSCHGEKGTPVEPDMPILWGQEFYYIYVQLKDYKSSRRHSEIMNDVVAELSRAEMKAARGRLALKIAKLCWQLGRKKAAESFLDRVIGEAPDSDLADEARELRAKWKL